VTEEFGGGHVTPGGWKREESETRMWCTVRASYEDLKKERRKT